MITCLEQMRWTSLTLCRSCLSTAPADASPLKAAGLSFLIAMSN